MRRGRSANQYTATRTPDQRARPSLPVASLGGDDLELAAWSFAPDSDGAWAWAFPEETERHKGMWQISKLDALEARELHAEYVSAGTTNGAMYRAVDIGPSEAADWEAQVPGLDPMTYSTLTRAGLTPHHFAEFRETGRVDHIAPYSPEVPPERHHLNVHNLHRIIDGWHDPRRTVAFIARVGGSERAHIARVLADALAPREDGEIARRAPSDVALGDRSWEDHDMFTAAARRPHWTWGSRLRRWWAGRQSGNGIAQ